MDWMLKAAIIIAIILLGAHLISRSRTRRLQDICYRYAGYDEERTSRGAYPSPDEMHEGMRAELSRITVEAGGITHELGGLVQATFEFFLDVPISLSSFFEQSVAGDVDSGLRTRVNRLVSQAQLCFDDLGADARVPNEFFDQSHVWLHDLKQWIEVVEKLAPHVGRMLRFRAQNASLY